MSGYCNDCGSHPCVCDLVAAVASGRRSSLAQADGSTVLLREVMAYRRGEGRYNFSRLPYDERGIACLEAWESLEKRIDAHLANIPR